MLPVSECVSFVLLDVAKGRGMLRCRGGKQLLYFQPRNRKDARKRSLSVSLCFEGENG